MWSGTPRADATDVLVGVDMTAKTPTIQVEDNGVGIDPHVTPGGRNTAARARASGGHATVVRRSEPATDDASLVAALRAGDHLHLGGTPA